MAPRPFTTFGAGADLTSAFASAEIPASHRSVDELTVPAGANPSKVCTFVQKAMLDPVTLGDVPVELRTLVESAAGQLQDDPGLVLAIPMAGNPLGDKMLTRLAPDDPDAKPFLFFGLVDG